MLRPRLHGKPWGKGPPGGRAWKGTEGQRFAGGAVSSPSSVLSVPLCVGPGQACPPWCFPPPHTLGDPVSALCSEMGNCPSRVCAVCVQTVTPMHLRCTHRHAGTLTCAHVHAHACCTHLHTLAAAPQVCLCTLASWGGDSEEEEDVATQGGSNLGVRPGAVPPRGQAQGDSDSSGPLTGVRGWCGVCRVEGTPACQPRGRKKPTVLQGPDVHQLGRGQQAGQAAPSTDPRLRNPNSRPRPRVLAPRPERPQVHPFSANLPKASAPQPWAPEPPSPGDCVGASKPRNLHSVPLCSKSPQGFFFFCDVCFVFIFLQQRVIFQYLHKDA